MYDLNSVLGWPVQFEFSAEAVCRGIVAECPSPVYVDKTQGAIFPLKRRFLCMARRLPSNPA